MSVCFNQEYLERIAKVCHNANKAFCDGIGDYSLDYWELTDENQKNSIIRGVAFRINNPNLSPEDQHNAWMKDKITDGWVYGEEKKRREKDTSLLVAIQ